MEETPDAREKRRRELLQGKLRRLDFLYSFEHKWLKDEPEQEVWLKENVEPRAWSWYQTIKAEFYEGVTSKVITYNGTKWVVKSCIHCGRDTEDGSHIVCNRSNDM